MGDNLPLLLSMLFHHRQQILCGPLGNVLVTLKQGRAVDRYLTFATEVTGEVIVCGWYIVLWQKYGEGSGCTEKSRLEKSRLIAKKFLYKQTQEQKVCFC